MTEFMVAGLMDVGSYPKEISVEDMITKHTQEQMQTLGYEAIVQENV